MISLLVAHDANRVIGKDNDLPWYIPEDLKYFKKMSMGKGIVMGRKTFESIGRPLPGRLNIVITRNENYSADGVTVVHNLEEAVNEAKTFADEVMVIGGAEIFTQSLALADRLYITAISQSFDGDTFFPEYEKNWKLVSSSEVHQTDDGTSYEFQVFERR